MYVYKYMEGSFGDLYHVTILAFIWREWRN